MSAEPAAAPGAPEVSESTETTELATASPSDGGQEQEQQATVGGRAQELLSMMGASDEVQEIVATANRKAEEKKATDEKDQKAEVSAESEPPEKIDAGRPEAGKTQKPIRQRPDQSPKDEVEEGLTDQEKNSWPKEALDRIHKVTAQKTALKTEREEAQRIASEATEQARQLHEQLQNAGRVRPAPTPADPLADVLSLHDLQVATKYCEDMLAFAELHPDGATDVEVGRDEAGNPIKRDIPASETAEMRATFGRIIRQAVPAKRDFLIEVAEHERYARATLPEMFDPKTEEYKASEQLLRQVPEIRRLPGYKQLIAWAFIGRETVIQALAQNKAGTNGHVKEQGSQNVDPKVAPFLRKHPPTAPGVPSTRGANTTVAPSKDSESKAAVDDFLKEGGGDDALERLVARKRSLQAAPRRDAALV